MDSKKILKVSTFLDEKEKISPTLLGAFLKRVEFSSDNKYIFCYCSYRVSKYLKKTNKEIDNYDKEFINNINNHSGKYPFWQKNDGSFGISKKFKILFILENDLNLTNNEKDLSNNFVSKLISKLHNSDFIVDSSLEKERKDFLRGFLDTAISYDGSNFMASDYYCKTKLDIKKIEILMLYELLDLSFFNFNVRCTNETTKKADQLRVNVKYYLKEIGTYNKYRAECVKENHKDFNDKKIIENDSVYYFDVSCEKKGKEKKVKEQNKFLQTYYQYLKIGYGYRVEGKMSETDILEYRKIFGFDKTSENEKKTLRSQSLKKWVLENEPDECVCCKDKYKIEDRTHFHKRKVNGKVEDKLYLEVHHVIPIAETFSDEKICELDDIDNLIKICPACHACITAKSGKEEDRRELLKNLLKNSDKIRKFVENYFGITDPDILLDKLVEVSR